MHQCLVTDNAFQPPVVAGAQSWEQFSNNIERILPIYVDNFQMNSYWVKGVLISVSGKDKIKIIN